ncbi:MAG TPA: diaminopimelate decarboxylase [Polyangia bacterium]|jgi:diaminopimelate decarboxylase|nr:diaminopimelate decarboxylase [Polyangia bacterium]
MSLLDLDHYPLERLANQVGTPFYLTDGGEVRSRLGRLQALTDGPALQARYAMKANSGWKVLETVRAAGLWIDAVSGNEVLRARRAGFPMGATPPVVMLTVDVLRDNALTTVLEHGVLPNVGSPGMIDELRGAGYRGPIALRVNPGFGHGHVESCDTGGPSSKHGVWHEALGALRERAAAAKLPITSLHAHIGTGPQVREFDENMRKLVDVYADILARFPDVDAVNLGGGLPHPYRPGAAEYDLAWFRPVLVEAAARLAKIAGRPIRVEIEPGRYSVAGAGLLVARVKDIKKTNANAKGPGHEFLMVDAGFNDLVRPAMYGSYHHISIVGKGTARAPEPFVVAGPLCESGDVFTRDDHELLDPRPLPRPDVGDLLVLHDAGAYGAAMSSNYVSLGRAPQVWWDDGKATLVARRESLEDVARAECDEPIA